MMKLPRRRQFLHLAAGAAALPVVSRFAWAQAYPSRPVRVIVMAPAGGGDDIVARLMSQFLSERLRQKVFVGEPPGAGGEIGARAGGPGGAGGSHPPLGGLGKAV